MGTSYSTGGPPSILVKLPKNIRLQIADCFNSNDPSVLAATLATRKLRELANLVLYRTISLSMVGQLEERRARVLCRVLKWHPDFSRFIRSLEIVRDPQEQQLRKWVSKNPKKNLQPQPRDADEDTLILYDAFEAIKRNAYDMETIIIPRIIRSARELQEFKLHANDPAPDAPFVKWSMFQPQLQSALEEVFKAQTLKSALISGIDGIPEALLTPLSQNITLLKVVNCKFIVNAKLPPSPIDPKGKYPESYPTEVRKAVSPLRNCFLGPMPLRNKKYWSREIPRLLTQLLYFITYRKDIPILQAILDKSGSSLEFLVVNTTKIFADIKEYADRRTGPQMGPLAWSWEGDGRLDVSKLSELVYLSVDFKAWTAAENGPVESDSEWIWALEILRGLLAAENIRRRRSGRKLSVIRLGVHWDESDRSKCKATWRPKLWQKWDRVLAELVSNGVDLIQIAIHGEPKINRTDSTQKAVTKAKILKDIRTNLPSIGDELKVYYGRTRIVSSI
ncbi:hypothetical protein FA15DRAFT_715986 [Coprinopsis marcescibilis]|uniref:F-box domain-containing protein n=1 Tax=Coprinopsis marcescibilis TaxID=230819 RepID=A0A5C3KN16_COPMA|nr:hypothetical protein FA15DRAFT_715986 [Coprinopsis marcescibilis]